MGLPGSGKTTLAGKLNQLFQEENINVSWFNADKIREQYNDWDFSKVGRLRQSERMRYLINSSLTDVTIVDLVAPLEEMRQTINPDYLIWVETITAGRYADTNSMFESPSKFNIKVTEQDCNKWGSIILKEILKLIDTKKGL